ncbi:hypothetical protein BDV96DRAFT_49605 [Lophiotrema nucula]|uniref:BZIP domain-containing protein n=1 Tax=Lophiotrema nucula TaxID=690887 RepID=A0A6A5ZA66_9PLEO|nr:hypothetical protein BDV96DRAFT_49605 [Lophiotrema nucula]
MNASTPQHAQSSSSRPGRKPKRNPESLEPGQKPRKVNSEVRKQQNRIASRNYREKRKRKLQYLQQLLCDSPNDQQTQQTSPSLEPAQDARTRSLSADYRTQEQSLHSAPFTPSLNYASLSSTSGNVIDPVLATSSSPYESHLLPTAQSFHSIEPSWSAPQLYEPPPPHSNISNWNVPHWMPDVNYAPQMQGGPEELMYSPPHAQQAFEQMPTPPQQPHEPVQNGNLFILGSYGHCRRHPDQSQDLSNVSLRSSSPYHQAQFLRAP